MEPGEGLESRVEGWRGKGVEGDEGFESRVES